MVGTGANRMPLTKIHPVLLGKQSGGSEGSSMLAHHRQQHNERMQNQNRGGPPNNNSGQMGGDRSFGSQQFGQSYPPMQQQQSFNNNGNRQTFQQPNMYQQQRPPMPQYNQMQQHSPFGNRPPLPAQPNQNYPAPPPPDQSSDGGKKRKRSRWGAKEERTIVTGPLTLPANMTEEQRKNYLLQFKIEEITQKLRSGELGIPSDPGERSPSPEPIYNSEGKRLNTREYRVRKKLEEERHILIKQAVDEVPNYKPPADYKPPAQKISDKVFIPQERNPAVNFIGLLIGPRGNTLKRLEKETGCKIIIRGKGSVKEGKVGRVPGQLMPGEDEPLHALITGPSAEEVRKGVKVVGDIVKEGIECPDAANELRRNQLRELAELNGTLIDEEIIKCKNCGATDHRHWECQEQKNITAQITCHKCGGYGHVAADCQVKVESNAGPLQTFAEKAKMDTEYMSLMAELGVDAPPPAKKPPQNLPQPPKETSIDSGSGIEKPAFNNRGNNADQERKQSKWGPPGGGGPDRGPKSLMDMNFGNRGPNPGNFRPDRPPRGPPNQNAPWVNQNRPYGPRGGGPQNNAPWNQNQSPRGPPPNNFNAPPPPQQQQQQQQPPPPPNSMGGYQQAQAPWAQQAPTAYPNQPQQWPAQYPGYNQYQQQQQSYAPPPPWAQQPPPPPPPPTTSSS